MSDERPDLDALAQEDVHADLERDERGVDLRPEEVREREGALGLPHDLEHRVRHPRHRLAGEERNDHHAAAVLVALQRLAEEAAVVAAEQLHPRVDLVRAVVAVHHRDLVPRGSRDDVDLGVVSLHRLLEHDHREDRRAGGDVARARGDRVRRDHARPGVALRRGHHRARLERSRRVEPLRAALGQDARLLAGLEHLRELLLERAAELRVERREHARVVVPGLWIDREHAARLADAHHVLAREPVVDVPRERREPPHLRNVRLLLQDRLAVVRDGPALRHVEPEHLRELRGGFGRHHVAPCAERDEELSVRVERKIPVHHAGDPERGELRQLRAVPRKRVRRALRVRVPNARLDLLERIAPHSVHERVLPVVRSLRDNLEPVVDKHRLDARRTELDAHRRPAGFYELLHFLNRLSLFFPLYANYTISKPRRATPGALRALGAGRLLASDSLPCWRKARCKTTVRHRFRGLLPFCLCLLASRQKGRRVEIGSPSWFCTVAHHAAQPPRASRPPLDFIALLPCESTWNGSCVGAGGREGSAASGVSALTTLPSQSPNPQPRITARLR